MRLVSLDCILFSIACGFFDKESFFEKNRDMFWLMLSEKMETTMKKKQKLSSGKKTITVSISLALSTRVEFQRSYCLEDLSNWLEGAALDEESLSFYEDLNNIDDDVLINGERPAREFLDTLAEYVDPDCERTRKFVELILQELSLSIDSAQNSDASL